VKPWFVSRSRKMLHIVSEKFVPMMVLSAQFIFDVTTKPYCGVFVIACNVIDRVSKIFHVYIVIIWKTSGGP